MILMGCFRHLNLGRQKFATVNWFSVYLKTILQYCIIGDHVIRYRIIGDPRDSLTHAINPQSESNHAHGHNSNIHRIITIVILLTKGVIIIQALIFTLTNSLLGGSDIQID
jgi:hypothetical protein